MLTFMASQIWGKTRSQIPGTTTRPVKVNMSKGRSEM